MGMHEQFPILFHVYFIYGLAYLNVHLQIHFPSLELRYRYRHRYRHSATTLNVGPGLVEVVLFGGCSKWPNSYVSDADFSQIAQTILIRFGKLVPSLHRTLLSLEYSCHLRPAIYEAGDALNHRIVFLYYSETFTCSYGKTSHTLPQKLYMLSQSHGHFIGNGDTKFEALCTENCNLEAYDLDTFTGPKCVHIINFSANDAGNPM